MACCWVTFKKMSEFAEIPKKGTSKSACFDVFSSVDKLIPPDTVCVLDTDLKVESISEQFCLKINSRSGLAAKGIFVANAPGIVDCDYRGEIRIILYNSTAFPYKVSIGDRIAQIEPQLVHEFVIYNGDDDSPFLEVEKGVVRKVRGTGGFGSTGK